MSCVEQFVVGDACSDETYIGPLFCASHVDRMKDLVKDAVHKGAKLACGGNCSDLDGTNLTIGCNRRPPQVPR